MLRFNETTPPGMCRLLFSKIVCVLFITSLLRFYLYKKFVAEPLV